MSIIQLENVSKEYRVVDRASVAKYKMLNTFFNRKYYTVKAVKNLSLSIREGEIVGYIGPNGAGKSTTIKLMCGILIPTSGEIYLNGLIPYENRKKNAYHIGVVFGQRSQLWWDLPVCNSFELLKRMYHVPDSDYNYRISIFNQLLDIKEFINVPVRNLSLGQKMRAEICAAFIHNPSVVFLDEPTIGLDIVAKRNIREFINNINKQFNTTIILTTHDISDIESVCNRVVLIDKGEKIFDNTLVELQNTYGNQERIIVTTQNEGKFSRELYAQGIDRVENKGNSIEISYNKSKISRNEVIKSCYSKCEVKDIVIQETTVEDVIYNIYRHNVKLVNQSL